MRTFESKMDFVSFVMAEVPLIGDAVQEQAALMETVSAPFAIEEADDSVPQGSRGLVIKRLRWVVQSDDLAALKAISDGAKAAAGAGFFAKAAALTAGPLAVAVVGVVFAAWALVRQARKKGARLTPDAMAVLGVLTAAHRPLTLTEIAGVLQQAFPDAEWTVERTTEQLTALQKQRLHDGTVKAFCAEDAVGTWSAVDPGLVI
jgi:hypothetical protein